MHHAAAGQTDPCAASHTSAHSLPLSPQYACCCREPACVKWFPCSRRTRQLPVQIALLLGLEPLHLRHTITLALGCIVRLLVTY